MITPTGFTPLSAGMVRVVANAVAMTAMHPSSEIRLADRR
jgi:hypothetical protein